MKRILITGATGAVGHKVVKQLLDEPPGELELFLFVRNTQKAKKIFKNDGTNLQFIKGDIINKEDVDQACKEKDVVFHTAGIPEQWLKDPSIFFKINVQGTNNIVQSCIKHNIEKLVYTSTIDVFKAKVGNPFDESIIDDEQRPTHYERSKQQADQIVTDACNKGLNAIFLHPSAVYGPGVNSSSNLNQLFVDMKLGKLPALLSGGMPLVYVDDVASGHILAWKKGKNGDRFILNEDYYSLKEIYHIVQQVSNTKKRTPLTLPNYLAKIIAYIGEIISNLTGRPPLIAKGQLAFLNWEAHPIAKKAKVQLGWKSTPFKEGLSKTLQST